MKDNEQTRMNRRFAIMSLLQAIAILICVVLSIQYFGRKAQDEKPSVALILASAKETPGWPRDISLGLQAACDQLDYNVYIEDNISTEGQSLREVTEKLVHRGVKHIFLANPGYQQELEYLEIFHNRITDVSCLTGLDHLMDLDLVQNYVEDLSPLAEIKSLKRLWIYRNIKDDLESPDEATVKMLQAALPDCLIEARGTSRSKGWVQHPHQEVIQRIFHSKVYEPFADSDPENMPEPWRTEHLEQEKNETEQSPQ